MPAPELMPVTSDGQTYFAHPAIAIGAGTKIGEGAQLHEGVQLGAGVYIGDAAVVGRGVRIGDRCIVEGRATLEEGVTLGGMVTIGTGAQLIDGMRQREDTIPQAARIEVGFGAAIGDNAAVRCTKTVRTVRIGAFAMLASGGTTTEASLAPFGLYDGNSRIGWVDPFGNIVSRKAREVPPIPRLTDGVGDALRDGSLSAAHQREFMWQVGAAVELLG